MPPDGASRDEGVLDPWVVRWLERQFGRVEVDLATEARAGTIPRFPSVPHRDVESVRDDIVEGVPVRIYGADGKSNGRVVYIHGGGFCSGSINAMDGFARELAHHSSAQVISVEYRLSPQHPYPAALDDCEAVTRWATTVDAPVAVAGESAGGSLAAALAIRFRDSGGPVLAGQALLYPSVDGGGSGLPSELDFGSLIVDRATSQQFWDSYRGGRDIDDDPQARPLAAASLAGLPPALVVVGGCDFLRDAGRAYASRLAAEGVPVTELCYAGQPHGFMNFMFPAAEYAFTDVGSWLRRRLVT